MSRRATIWLVLAVLFSIVNLLGVWYAAVHEEVAHGGAHAGLLVLTAVFVWRLMPRRVASY